MKDIIDTILNNIQYIYPGYIVILIYQYINADDSEETNRFFLKIVCISYIMVKIIGSLSNIICHQISFSEDAAAIFNHIILFLSSVLLPFLFYKIQNSKLIKKFLEWNKISRNTAKNIEELILGYCPKNSVVYCVVYLESIILEGILIYGETGENGNIFLSNWKKKCSNELYTQIQSKNTRDNNSTIVIPKNRIIAFNYEYIPRNGKMPT